MTDKEYIIDRFEGDYVIVEDENDNLININKSDIIGEVKEGDILVKKDNFYYIDKEKTILRREKINNMMEGLWE